MNKNPLIEESEMLADGATILYRVENIFGESHWGVAVRNGDKWDLAGGSVFSTEWLLDFISGEDVTEAYLVTDKEQIK